jgi:hypothetical protein
MKVAFITGGADQSSHYDANNMTKVLAKQMKRFFRISEVKHGASKY